MGLAWELLQEISIHLMEYVISSYNHDLSWLNLYSDDYVIYDRSEKPTREFANVVRVPNIGSDIYDKFTFIIDNYSNLPEVAIYTKANLFKYITKEEFNLIKDNKIFTPILTMNHQEVMCGWDKTKPFSYYKDGIYWELNSLGYLNFNPPKSWEAVEELLKLLGIDKMEYTPFAPGSNYILPKENILKHPKEFYEKLRGYLDWAIYPGEAMVIERGLYNIWS